MNLMQYKGYRTRPEYSSEDDCFVGKVLGINDLIIFTGESVNEFREAFHTCIDDYLIACEANGIEPDKEYSGQFNFRISPEKHRKLSLEAKKQGLSLNALVNKACDNILNPA